MCRAEAPGVEQFARRNAAQLAVVGLGTQDSLPEARDFVARYKISFRMLWDDGFSSWRALEIAAQPAAILFSADGRELRRWQGSFPEDDVLRLARQA